MGLKEAANRDVDDENHGEQNSRQDAAGKQPPDGLAGQGGVENHGDAGGDQNPQRAPAGDAAHGDDFVVPAAEHGRQGDDAHGHGGGGADAGHGGKDGADEDGADGQAPVYGAHPAVHHRVKLIGHPGPLQDHGHEHEKRDGQKGEFPHGPVGLGGRHEETFASPEEVAADDAHAAEDKGQGKPEGEEEDEGAEKEDGDELNAHERPPSR